MYNTCTYIPVTSDYLLFLIKTINTHTIRKWLITDNEKEE